MNTSHARAAAAIVAVCLSTAAAACMAGGDERGTGSGSGGSGTSTTPPAPPPSPVPKEVGRPLASGLKVGPWDHLALDADHVYFSADAGVYKVSIEGGVPIKLAEAIKVAANAPFQLGQNSVWALAVGPSGVYWSGAGVWRVGLDGGAVTQLASTGLGLALDDTYVYWTDVYNIVRAPIAGGPTTVLASNLEGPLLAVTDAANVYFRDGVDEDVKVVPKGGGPVVTLSSPPHGNVVCPPVLSAGPTNLYWSGCRFIGIGLVPKAGGPTIEIPATGEPQPAGVAADDTDVYWTDYVGGWVWKMPAAGGPSTPFASNGKSSGSGLDIVMDATTIYWLDAYGTLYKAPK